MTRINLIPVIELTDQHLLAEHREIKRIPNLIKSGKYNLENIPESFCLGTGHVKFFYNKLFFLYTRYLQLYNECLKRGFKVDNYEISFFHVRFTDNWNYYYPTERDIEISRQRIEEKIKQKPLFYKHYGKQYVSKEN